MNKRRGCTQVLKQKRKVVYNFWPPLVWGASISCLHSLLHGKDKEDFLRQYVTWTKIAILENWYNNVPRCFHYSKSWKCTPKDSVTERSLILFDVSVVFLTLIGFSVIWPSDWFGPQEGQDGVNRQKRACKPSDFKWNCNLIFVVNKNKIYQSEGNIY